MPPRKQAHADLVLFAITLFWGLTFAFIQQGLAHASTFSFLTVRFAVGALALAVLARFRVFAWKANLAGLALGSISFLGFALQTAGLQYTTVSRSAFLTGLTVVLVPVGSGLLARRPGRGSLAALAVVALGIGGATWGGGALSPALWAALISLALAGIIMLPALSPGVRGAVALAMAGLALMTRPVGDASAATLRGDLLTLGCTLAFGLTIIASAHVAPRYPVMPTVFGQLVGVGVWSAVVNLFVGWRFESCPALWQSVLFCGVVASAVCITGQTWAMKRASATRTALVYALEPVAASAFAYLWTGETLGRIEALGGGLIVLGTLVEPLRQIVQRATEGDAAVEPE